MNRHILACLFFTLLLSSYSCTSQTSRLQKIIEGDIADNKVQKVTLQSFDQNKTEVATAIVEQNNFRLLLPVNSPSGVYRLVVTSQESEVFFDLIHVSHEKQVVLHIDQQKPFPIQFTQSEENINWYSFLQKEVQYKDSIVQLNNQLSFNPSTRHSILKQIKDVKHNYNKDLNFFIQEHKQSWASKMVANNPYRLDLSIENYWATIDTKDTSLLHSPIFSEAIIHYFRSLSSSNPNQLTSAVDEVMNAFSHHTKTKEYAYTYLTTLFRNSAKDELLAYLDNNYQEQSQCLPDRERTLYHDRMKGYDVMNIGNPAPTILFTNSQLDYSSLADIHAEQTIVMFWASYCPYCMQELPLIHQWITKNNTYKLLAISLDTDPDSYRSVINEYPNFIHYTDYKQWESKPVVDYYITATPTFYVLNKQKNIEAKFSNAKDLINYMSK